MMSDAKEAGKIIYAAHCALRREGVTHYMKIMSRMQEEKFKSRTPPILASAFDKAINEYKRTLLHAICKNAPR